MVHVSLKFKCRPVNAGKRARMAAAQETYRAACAWFAEQAEQLGTTGRNRLHHALYAEAGTKFNLNRPTLQAALGKALAARRVYLAHQSQGREVSSPTFTRPVPVTVRQDSWSIRQLPSGGWIVKFPVAAGRSQISVPIHLSAYHRTRLEDLEQGRCRPGTLEFWEDREGTWWVAATLVYPPRLGVAAGVIGVDLGLRHRAVTSTSRFYHGRQVQWRKERWAERRAALQKAGRKARMKRESGRERRWMRSLNHQLARALVNEAVVAGQGLALEDLAGIRDRTRKGRKLNRQLHNWNWAELGAFVDYKSELAGVPVVRVDPAFTSQTCPRCGWCARENRSRSWFRCTRCGYQTDADRAGALNIRARARDDAGEV